MNVCNPVIVGIKIILHLFKCFFGQFRLMLNLRDDHLKFFHRYLLIVPAVKFAEPNGSVPSEIEKNRRNLID